MKLAIIAPRNTELSSLGDYEFVLAQHITEDDEAHYSEMSSRGREIIIDHGAFELGHPAMPDEEYLELAERIKATTIIAPDLQWNPHKTHLKTMKFAKMFRDSGYNTSMKLMAVVWSAGPGDIGIWFKRCMLNVEPDIYGIGKWYESMYADRSREQLIQGLMQNFDVKPEQFHALGCPYAHEVYRLRSLVGSMDTGLAVKAVVQDKVVYLNQEPKTRLEPVSLRDLNEYELWCASKNAKYLLRLAHMK